MTMKIVTHETAFAGDVSNDVIFMDNGYIVEQEPPEKVFGDPKEEKDGHFLSRYTLG